MENLPWGTPNLDLVNKPQVGDRKTQNWSWLIVPQAVAGCDVHHTDVHFQKLCWKWESNALIYNTFQTRKNLNYTGSESEKRKMIFVWMGCALAKITALCSKELCETQKSELDSLPSKKLHWEWFGSDGSLWFQLSCFDVKLAETIDQKTSNTTMESFLGWWEDGMRQYFTKILGSQKSKSYWEKNPFKFERDALPAKTFLSLPHGVWWKWFLFKIG